MASHPPRFVQAESDAPDTHAEITHSLLATPATVAPKYFYDALGSALFGAITELPEYYPTRTEAAIFARHGGAIGADARSRLPAEFALVDLGAGNGEKAARLFDAVRPKRYVAVDISADYLRQSLHALQQRHADIECVGVAADFSRRLALPAGVHDGAALVFYAGSSIGNFAPADALRLLREAHALSRGGALLIGVDLLKPREVLEAAYDDALGVTAAFNLNLLRHLNRIAGTDFDVRDWQHVATFNAAESRIEMHLQARRALVVRWPGHERRFAAGERVHTENSYKWSGEGFESLLRDAGWRHVRGWTDDQHWFGVFLAGA